MPLDLKHEVDELAFGTAADELSVIDRANAALS
jgi:hypothetical protein